MNASSELERLESLSRERALSDEESRELERLLRRQPSARIFKLWLPKDDLAVARMIRRRKRIPDIASAVGVSEAALRKRLDKLRRQGKIGYISPVGGTGRYPRNNPKAAHGQHG